LDSKLAKIKTLIIEKERVDSELAQLLGEAPKTRRGRPAKEKGPDESGQSQGGS
jgi:hypothetical protein